MFGRSRALRRKWAASLTIRSNENPASDGGVILRPLQTCYRPRNDLPPKWSFNPP